MERGGITAQVFGYAPELWELFGITVLNVAGGLWDLDLLEFLSLVAHIDNEREKRAAQRAKQAAREKEEARGR